MPAVADIGLFPESTGPAAAIAPSRPRITTRVHFTGSDFFGATCSPTKMNAIPDPSPLKNQAKKALPSKGHIPKEPNQFPASPAITEAARASGIKRMYLITCIGHLTPAGRGRARSARPTSEASGLTRLVRWPILHRPKIPPLLILPTLQLQVTE